MVLTTLAMCSSNRITDAAEEQDPQIADCLGIALRKMWVGIQALTGRLPNIGPT